MGETNKTFEILSDVGKDTYYLDTYSLGNNGTASVGLRKGFLSFDFQDVSWNGNRMPASISRHYSQNIPTIPDSVLFSSMKIGNGWRLNLMQSLVQSGDGYVYTDGNGNELWFFTNDGSNYTDEAELGYTYNPTLNTMTKGDYTYKFSYKRLITVSDKYGNTLNINYYNNKIKDVVDGIGRIYLLFINLTVI